MTKKTILIFTDWYVPGFKAGGPVKSIFSLVNLLKSEFNFLIITSDTDFGSEKPYDDIVSNKWVKVDDSSSVFYASKEYLNYNSLTKLLQLINYDSVYLNSFFSFKYSILPLILKKKNVIPTPILLAPRGMLGKGALNIKPFKKKVFIGLSKLFKLHKNVYFQATSDQERFEIIENLGDKNQIFVRKNLQYTPDLKITKPCFKEKRKVRFVFISRISVKKNLYQALEILSENASLSIVFDIYGPIEDERYWKKCLILIDKCKQKGIEVNYKGSIKSEMVLDTLSKHHFLLLPTFNENFGHIIAESFQSGVPVVISDQTPWRQLEKERVGWDVALDDSDKFKEIITECLHMDNEMYLGLHKNAKDYYLNNCQSDDLINSTVEMFKTIINE